MDELAEDLKLVKNYASLLQEVRERCPFTYRYMKSKLSLLAEGDESSAQYFKLRREEAGRAREVAIELLDFREIDFDEE